MESNASNQGRMGSLSRDGDDALMQETSLAVRQCGSRVKPFGEAMEDSEEW
jgi:hypothetical protein